MMLNNNTATYLMVLLTTKLNGRSLSIVSFFPIHISTPSLHWSLPLVSIVEEAHLVSWSNVVKGN